MKAEDLLPDDQNRADIRGLSVRKGTVAAFLANARTWIDPQASAVERSVAEQDMAEALPALRGVGLFEVLEVRDERLRGWLAER